MERTQESDLTLILLVFWWLNEAFELHVDVDLDAKKKSYLQEHQLQLANTWSKIIQKHRLNLSSDSTSGSDILGVSLIGCITSARRSIQQHTHPSYFSSWAKLLYLAGKVYSLCFGRFSPTHTTMITWGGGYWTSGMHQHILAFTPHLIGVPEHLRRWFESPRCIVTHLHLHLEL